MSIYDLESKKRLCRLPKAPGPVFCLAYHPKQPRLATGIGNRVAIWDLQSGKLLCQFFKRNRVTCIAWHPRGHRLAVGCDNGPDEIDLCDADTGHSITGTWRGHKTGGIQVAFNHAGDRVVSTDWHGALRFWDAATGRLLLSVSEASIYHQLHFGAGDQTFELASGAGKRWDHRFAGGQELRTWQRPTPNGVHRIHDIALHPDGRLLAFYGPTGLCFVDLFTGEALSFVARNFNGFVRLDATGAFWIAGSAGLLRWPIRSHPGSSQTYRVGPPEWIGEVSGNLADTCGISRSGDVALIPMYTNGALLIHWREPRRTFRLGPQYDVRHGLVSPDGKWALTFSHWADASGLHTKLWHAESGKFAATLPADARGDTCTFSPDSRWIHITGMDSRRVEIASIVAAPSPLSAPLNLRPWEEKWKAEPRQLGGAFSPDGRIRAHGLDNGEIRLVTTDGEIEIARLPASEADRIAPHGFSPDGSLLMGTSVETGALYIFDLRRIRVQLAELGLDWSGMQPLPIAKTVDPLAEPLSVKLEGAEWVNSRAKIMKYEADGATLRLVANPLDADAHFRLSEGLLQAGKPSSAYAHLTFALALRPELDEAMLMRATAAFRMQRWEEVEADTTRYLTKYSFDSRARLLRAQMYRVRRLYAEATADYSELLKSYPSTVTYLEERALCYSAMGNADLATADRVQAIKLGASAMTRHDHARYLVTTPADKRDPAKTLELILEAVKTQPNNPAFLNTLGLVQFRNGQFKESVATLERAPAFSKGQTDVARLFILAMAHARLSENAKAKDCFDRALTTMEAQKNRPPLELAELREWRAEAEAIMRDIKK